MLSDGLLIFGGVIAGIINTLAGNGSVITLSLCTEWVGLSPSIANGTNRLGVLTQSIAGTASLYHHKRMKLEGTYRYMLVVGVGAICGILLASYIDDQSFRKIYPWFLVFIFLILIFKPERWLKTNIASDYQAPWYIWPIYFIIGVYGGLIQVGVGVFFLATSVMLGRMPWGNANAAKIVIVGLFTLVAVFIFRLNGLFDLRTAIFLATGQSVGAWLGVKYLDKIPQAQKLSYYLLLTITGITIIKQFFL